MSTIGIAIIVAAVGVLTMEIMIKKFKRKNNYPL
jgi:uncharacterized membrane protein